MVEDVEYLRAVHITPLYIRELLQVGGTVKPPVWSIDMGNVYQDWEEPEWVPSQSGPPSGKDAVKEGHYEQVNLPTSVSDNYGSGCGGGGTYILYSHSIVAQYITTQPILNFFSL